MSARLDPPPSARRAPAAGCTNEDVDDLTLELTSGDPTANLDGPADKNPDQSGLNSGAASQNAVVCAVDAPQSRHQALQVGPGTRLRQRYLLQQAIGSGGTSMVYRAQDLHRNIAGSQAHVMAVKLLRAELQEDARAIERLKREFTQMQLLAHPGVLKVFDIDVDKGVWFMTMELLEGQSLSMYLRTHRDSHPKAMDIVKACAEALQYAHERGVLHGDLKPGNIFLTAGGVRVLDFVGVADDQLTERAATPAYASPQRLNGEPPEPSDDVYSLGCVTYELLTGEHPFARKPGSVARELGLQPARINSLSYRQWRALDRALAFDRLDRHASLRSFMEAFFGEAADTAHDVAAHKLPSTDDEASSKGVIPVVMPALVLARAQETVGEGSPAVDAVTEPPTESAVALHRSGLHRRETAASNKPSPERGEPAKSLPPLFESPRASVALPVVVGLVLALMAVYLARSDLQPTFDEAATEAQAIAVPLQLPQSDDKEEPVGGNPATLAMPDAENSAADLTATGENPAAAPPAVVTPIAEARSMGHTPARAASVSLETSRVSVSERSVAAVVQVKRLGEGASSRLPVRWRAEKRSALPGEDFGEITSGTIILQDGQRMGTIFIPIINDDVPESDEMFVVELISTPTVQAENIGLSIVTIRDDDRVLLTSTQ